MWVGWLGFWSFEGKAISAEQSKCKVGRVVRVWARVRVLVLLVWARARVRVTLFWGLVYLECEWTSSALAVLNCYDMHAAQVQSKVGLDLGIGLDLGLV